MSTNNSNLKGDLHALQEVFRELTLRLTETAGNLWRSGLPNAGVIVQHKKSARRPFLELQDAAYPRDPAEPATTLPCKPAALSLPPTPSPPTRTDPPSPPLPPRFPPRTFPLRPPHSPPLPSTTQLATSRPSPERPPPRTKPLSPFRVARSCPLSPSHS